MAKICITMKEIRSYEKRNYEKAMAGINAKNYIRQEESLANKLAHMLNGSMADNGETKIALSTINEKAGYDYALLCATILEEHNYKWRQLIIWYLNVLISKQVIGHPKAASLVNALSRFNNMQISADELSEYSITAFELVKEAYTNKEEPYKIVYLRILASALTLSPANVMLDRTFINDPITKEKFLEVVNKD
jgi:hypothetical protein